MRKSRNEANVSETLSETPNPGEPQASIPAPSPQASIPAPSPQASIPAPSPQASIPAPSPQASIPAPTPEIQAGMAELAAQILDGLTANTIALRESAAKTHTSFIEYMDRIILLAGGTLTLTFTAVASVGAHLRESHHDAARIYHVTTACWLLIATIVLGLVFNNCTIKLRQFEDIEASFAAMHSQWTRKLYSITQISPAAVEVLQKLPSIFDTKEVKTIRWTVKILRVITRVAGVLSMAALVAAFVFLTLFIQANIREMLSQ
jgi:hypothetical protein